MCAGEPAIGVTRDCGFGRQWPHLRIAADSPLTGGAHRPGIFIYFQNTVPACKSATCCLQASCGNANLWIRTLKSQDEAWAKMHQHYLDYRGMRPLALSPQVKRFPSNIFIKHTLWQTGPSRWESHDGATVTKGNSTCTALCCSPDSSRMCWQPATGDSQEIHICEGQVQESGHCRAVDTLAVEANLVDIVGGEANPTHNGSVTMPVRTRSSYSDDSYSTIKAGMEAGFQPVFARLMSLDGTSSTPTSGLSSSLDAMCSIYLRAVYQNGGAFDRRAESVCDAMIQSSTGSVLFTRLHQ